MDIKRLVSEGIQNAVLSPDTIARADAAILRSIAREVERAIVIANHASMWKGSGPATYEQRLACAEATSRWENLAYDCETTLRRAILSTPSYEAAAQLIEEGRVK